MMAIGEMFKYTYKFGIDLKSKVDLPYQSAREWAEAIRLKLLRHVKLSDTSYVSVLTWEDTDHIYIVHEHHNTGEWWVFDLGMRANRAVIKDCLMVVRGIG